MRNLVCVRHENEQAIRWVATVQPGSEQTAMWRLLPADPDYVKLAPVGAPALRLDLTNPDQIPVLRSDQNVSGQAWRLQQSEDDPERHVLSAMWSGPQKILVAVAGGEVALRSATSIFGQQSWCVSDATATPPDLDQVPQQQAVENQGGGINTDEIDAGDVPTCRICFDTGNGSGDERLFSPCLCRGSMRYVHVGCLNQWRCTATNSAAHYRCDSCHYEYRVQRTQLAQCMLSPRAPVCLVIVTFLVAAALLGFLVRLLFPGQHAELLGKLLGALRVRIPREEEAGGNLLLWVVLRVLNAPLWQHAAGNTSTAMLAQVAISGTLALSIPGFFLFLQRELFRPEGGARMDMHGVMLVLSLSTFASPQLGRFAICIGVAVSLRELYSYSHEASKRIAQIAGEKVLEVA